MNPEGVEWSVFDYPIEEAINLININPLEGDNRLLTEELYSLINYNQFTHVYDISHMGKYWMRIHGTWSFFVKHQSGCYVMCVISYSSVTHKFTTGEVSYSMSWSKMCNQLSTSDQNKLKNRSWYKSCERTRAALLALSVLQRKGLFARDLFRMVAEWVWEKRFNN